MKMLNTLETLINFKRLKDLKELKIFKALVTLFFYLQLLRMEINISLKPGSLEIYLEKYSFKSG